MLVDVVTAPHRVLDLDEIYAKCRNCDRAFVRLVGQRPITLDAQREFDARTTTDLIVIRDAGYVRADIELPEGIAIGAPSNRRALGGLCTSPRCAADAVDRSCPSVIAP